MKYERETCNLLRRLGVNNSYVGFRYTVYGVIRAIANPELLSTFPKGFTWKYLRNIIHPLAVWNAISAPSSAPYGCMETVLF